MLMDINLTLGVMNVKTVKLNSPSNFPAMWYARINAEGLLLHT